MNTTDKIMVEGAYKPGYRFIYTDLQTRYPPWWQRLLRCRPVMVLRWACTGVGFGELTFYQDRRGEWFCQTEGMNDKFVVQAIQHWLAGVRK